MARETSLFIYLLREAEVSVADSFVVAIRKIGVNVGYTLHCPPEGRSEVGALNFRVRYGSVKLSDIRFSHLLKLFLALDQSV